MKHKIVGLIALLSIVAVASGENRPKTAAEKAFPEPMPMVDGKFEPTWQSLKQYDCPEWFRDAKFGIWAHWGPQCQPEEGDWYARRMYEQAVLDPKTGEQKPTANYSYHVEHYGHPSKFGFKDVINQWKAENWNPEKLMALYKRAGAKYFMAMGNHHDNFDTWASTYQPWNSVNIGPKKDLIDGWAKAARQEGLRFGVSLHAARAWTWLEVAQGADKTGPLAGVPYDGNLTQADGKGLWWDGLDPQDLYAQNHPVGALPDQAYCIKFYNRTMQLVEKYQPDLIYFDDAIVPLNGLPGNFGMKIVSDFYNRNMEWHKGKVEAVINLKRLEGDQQKCLVNDIERGRSDKIEPYPWQTDTCLAGWHYLRWVYEQHQYKKPGVVIQLLIDVVSKNANLMLSVPVRGDGTIDSDETEILEKIGAWMDINKEGIYATRPWKIFGEGPSTTGPQDPGTCGGTVDVPNKPYTAEDIRFTVSKDGSTLYAFFLAWPKNGEIKVRSLAKASTFDPTVRSLVLLGSSEKLTWKQDAQGLQVKLPPQAPGESAWTLKVKFK